MAEMVASAVAEETVNQVLSGLIRKYKGKSNETERMERLDIAHIKLEAALETSNKWQITDVPLLRWRKKLKRAAQECDNTLRKCKQRILVDEEREQRVRQSSFPKRISYATKSFISSFLSHNNDEPSSSVVRRFEWFADGASDFLRFVELGCTPRQYMFFDPLIGHLFAGKELQYKSKYHLFSVCPISFEERGLEAKLLFAYEDEKAPEKNVYLGLMLRLSESTNIVEITIKCLQLVTPHFKSAAEVARKELIQLPTQDFSWVPYVVSSNREHWDNIHSTSTQWFRPNPLCCKQHEHKPSSNNTNILESSDISLEPVIEVSLLHHIPLSEYNWQRTIVEGERNFSKDMTYLRLGLLITPHGSSEDMQPTVESSTTEIIDGEEQHSTHTNVSLQQLDEIMLPKSIDCLYQKVEATSYQMFWISKHGTACLQVQKIRKEMPSTRRAMWEARNEEMIQQQDLERWTQIIIEFLELWVTHAPKRLQGSIVEWIQTANEMQSAARLISL